MKTKKRKEGGREMSKFQETGQRPLYGAPELKRVYRKYFLFGFGIAIFIHLIILGSYYLVQAFQKEEAPMVTVRILKYSELGPPPSLLGAQTPQANIAGSVAKPRVGIPVPVPEAEVSSEQIFATQKELGSIISPITATGGGTESIVVSPEEVKVEEESLPEFVPYEKEPIVVRSVRPEYPELARRASLEGTVWVKIWVDKEGKPRKAVVAKSDAEIFNEVSAKAAMQFVFTPALMNNGPVAVWVIIPFRFTLKK